MDEIELRTLLSERALQMSEIYKSAGSAMEPYIKAKELVDGIVNSNHYTELSKQISHVAEGFKLIEGSVKPFTELANSYGEMLKVISNNRSELELSEEQLEDLSNLKAKQEFEEELEKMDEEKIFRLKTFIQKTSNYITTQSNDYSNYKSLEDYLIVNGLTELYPELSFLFMTIDIGLIYLINENK